MTTKQRTLIGTFCLSIFAAFMIGSTATAEVIVDKKLDKNFKERLKTLELRMGIHEDHCTRHETEISDLRLRLKYAEAHITVLEQKQ